MISLFKRTTIAIAIFNLTSSTFAGTVTGAFIGAEGLDLQPRNGDLDYLILHPNSRTNAVNVYALRPGYSWDFRLYAGINFCGDEDITVSWLRYHTSDNATFGTPIVDGSVVTSQIRWLTTTAWEDIASHISFDLDEVYGVYAHTSHLGAWDLRLGAGLDWARLYSDLRVSGNLGGEGNVGGEGNLGYLAESHLRAFGPRVDIDMTYKMPYNLSVFAKSTLALLIAKREVELISVEDFAGLYPSVYFPNRHVAIPKIGIRVGAAYTYYFGEVGSEGAICQTSSLNIEAGWHNEVYIHAIERPCGLANLTGQGSNTYTKISNFGDEGLFIGAKLSTNWF